MIADVLSDAIRRIDFYLDEVPAKYAEHYDDILILKMSMLALIKKLDTRQPKPKQR
ncbi:MAG: hypothetical protein GY797_02535 [Deltaproteobacteria bacterium]|nr:hypothetical protein [Deltaproteobacteria bacterium]